MDVLSKNKVYKKDTYRGNDIRELLNMNMDETIYLNSKENLDNKRQKKE